MPSLNDHKISSDHVGSPILSLRTIVTLAVGIVIGCTIMSVSQSSSSVQVLKTAIKVSNDFDPGIKSMFGARELNANKSRHDGAAERLKGGSDNVATADMPENPNDNIPILSRMTVSPDAGKSELKGVDKKDMNIVIFYADDWTFRTMGLVNNAVHTPNIDAIGRNGMLFPYNSVTTSICWQSRATLVTGKFVSVHQHTHIFSQNLFQKNDWTKTLYPLLKENGYHNGFIGKWHAPLPPDAAAKAFDHKELYYGSHWMNVDGERKHVTERNGQDALHYLQEVKPQGKKFSLTVSFFATHSVDGQRYPNQYQPQPYSEPLYNETIPTPKTATEAEWEKNPWFFTERNEARMRWRQRYDTPDHYQETMKRYYRMATEVDDVVGKVVNELKAQGEYENTFILFTTDNGNFHGEHGLAGKWYPHEESVRVPLVIQDPRMPPTMRGTINNEFTLNIDLAPTILSAAGIPVPEVMQGRDMAELYFRPKPATDSWRKDFFYEWTQDLRPGAPNHNDGRIDHIPAVNALIARDYKYFYYLQTKYEQLFRIERDPYEEFDIYNETQQNNPELLAKIKARFSQLRSISQAGQKV